MKKIFILFAVFILACGDEKEPVIPTPTPEEIATRKAKLHEKEKKEKKDRIDCTWDMRHDHPDPKMRFNKKKRDSTFNIADSGQAPIKANRGKKPPPSTEPPTTPPPTPTGNGGMFLLSFYGKTVSGTMWNLDGNIIASHSGFAQPEIDYVILRIASHYNMWYTSFTIDENVYNASTVPQKCEVIFTESDDWYCGVNPCAGGVAYINSASWASKSPAWVFTAALSYNTRNVAEAGAHEIGHTLGLRHQTDNATCSNYSVGKTMGNGYQDALSVWFKGPSSAACAIQTDTLVLTSKLGRR